MRVSLRFRAILGATFLSFCLWVAPAVLASPTGPLAAGGCPPAALEKVLGLRLGWVQTLVGLAESCGLPPALRASIERSLEHGPRGGLVALRGLGIEFVYLETVCPGGLRVVSGALRDTPSAELGAVLVERCQLGRHGIGPQPIALEPGALLLALTVAGWQMAAEPASGRRLLQHLLSAPRRTQNRPPRLRPFLSPGRIPGLKEESPLPWQPAKPWSGAGAGVGGAGGAGCNGGGGCGGSGGWPGVRRAADRFARVVEPARGVRTRYLRVAPRRVAGEDPVYPTSVSAAERTQVVRVRVLTHSDGRVRRAWPLGRAAPALTAACVKAVRGWRFAATRSESADVAASFVVRCAFAEPN